MKTISAVNFSKNILNSEDYSGIQETLYLLSIPGMREKLQAGINEPLSECIPEEEVEW